MANKSGPWYAVSGKAVKGPFIEYADAKATLNLRIGSHADEIIVKGGLYRYGAEYVGMPEHLNSRKLANIARVTSAPERRATHYAVVMGQEQPGGYIRTLHTASWVKLS